MKIMTDCNHFFLYQVLFFFSLTTSQQQCLSLDIISTSVIAFGSCNRQNKPQFHWDIIKATNPDLFLWTGDSVYAKNNSIRGLEVAFKNLTNNELYRKFESGVQVDGIWDDHDMGVNDGGRHVTQRKERQEMFLKYISKNSYSEMNNTYDVTDDESQEVDQNCVRTDSEKKCSSFIAAANGLKIENTKESLSNSEDSHHQSRQERQDGLYKTIDRKFGMHGPNVRFILLDTRSHRDNHYIKSLGEFKFPLSPVLAALIRCTYSVLGVGRHHEGNILGDDQWKWLESSISESTADFHVLISSIQILTSNPVVESWGHFPKEKKRLLDLLKKLDPPGLFFLSGDVHHGELSRAVVVREKSSREESVDAVVGGVFGDRDVLGSAGGPVDENEDKRKQSKDAFKVASNESEGDDVWVEVTSSGLTHTCGDSFFNRILCPNMLQMFSEHRLPRHSPPHTAPHDHTNSHSTTAKKENYFIGTNFGLIRDVSTEFNLALNVSVIGIDTHAVELSYVVHSHRHSCEGSVSLSEHSVGDSDSSSGAGQHTHTHIRRHSCTPNPVLEVITADFPLYIPKSVSEYFTKLNFVLLILLIQFLVFAVKLMSKRR